MHWISGIDRRRTLWLSDEKTITHNLSSTHFNQSTSQDAAYDQISSLSGISQKYDYSAHMCAYICVCVCEEEGKLEKYVVIKVGKIN